MPQAIWTGAISFGLVSVPVRLYPATRRKDVRFHELDRVTGQRIRHQRVRFTEPEIFEPRAWQPPTPPTAPPADRPTRVHLEDAGPQPGKVLPAMPAAVAREELVKGFEVAPDQYVTVDPAEIEALAPE